VVRHQFNLVGRKFALLKDGKLIELHRKSDIDIFISSLETSYRIIKCKHWQASKKTPFTLS
jgi:hypothetical protein